MRWVCCVYGRRVKKKENEGGSSSKKCFYIVHQVKKRRESEEESGRTDTSTRLSKHLFFRSLRLMMMLEIASTP